MEPEKFGRDATQTQANACTEKEKPIRFAKVVLARETIGQGGYGLDSRAFEIALDRLLDDLLLG